ncbi:hypothetical protein Taro_043137, partial [Colocasia esculenta]|nr:hypothetical protein [Colocasia esculenta]
ASAEQSSVNNNIGSNASGTSSQEMRLRSDLWHDVIHSTGQIFVSVEHLQNDLTNESETLFYSTSTNEMY